jgi:invasion protein IalB
MSSLRLFLLVLMLAGAPGAGGVVAQQPLDAPGSARKAMPLSTSPRLAAQSTAATPSQQLPNGASSISETYGDWTVNCRLVDGQKQCLLLHAQGNGQTGQRVFAIELRIPKDGKTEGTILMPFGLKLDSGAILKLDDKDLGQGLRFSTCMPQGCLLPVSLPTVAVDAMKKAKMLTVASLNASSGEVITFNVPLEGFAAAIARIAELGR